MNHYSKILNEYGDVDLVTFKEGHFDEDNWWIEDRYEAVDGYYIGYPKEVYLYNGEYWTDLPYEEQKNDKRSVYVIDEI